MAQTKFQKTDFQWDPFSEAQLIDKCLVCKYEDHTLNLSFLERMIPLESPTLTLQRLRMYIP